MAVTGSMAHGASPNAAGKYLVRAPSATDMATQLGEVNALNDVGPGPGFARCHHI